MGSPTSAECPGETDEYQFTPTLTLPPLRGKVRMGVLPPSLKITLTEYEVNHDSPPHSNSPSTTQTEPLLAMGEGAPKSVPDR